MATDAGAASGAPTLLIVEDDPETCRILARVMGAHGFRVVTADSARAALEAWERRRPDLVLLDLGLPDRDGVAVIRRFRDDATTPILVISARDREGEKVRALEAGADDYVTKPFGLGELQARIRALLRRAAGPAADAAGVVRLGSLVLDPARHLVTVEATPVSLSPREFEVLRVLAASAGRIVTRNRLLRAVWGAAYDEKAHYVHVYVSQIRRKLAAADPEHRLDGLIVSEPGVGYRVRLDEPEDEEAGRGPRSS